MEINQDTKDYKETFLPYLNRKSKKKQLKNSIQIHKSEFKIQKSNSQLPTYDAFKDRHLNMYLINSKLKKKQLMNVGITQALNLDNKQKLINSQKIISMVKRRPKLQSSIEGQKSSRKLVEAEQKKYVNQTKISGKIVSKLDFNNYIKSMRSKIQNQLKKDTS